MIFVTGDTHGEPKRLKIHPPHSRDFSRELGGCGRPYI